MANHSAAADLLRRCGIPAFILAAFVCWIIEAEIFGARRAEDIYAAVEWTMKAQTAGTATLSYEEGNAPQARLVPIKPDENGIAKASVMIPRDGRYRSFSITLLDRPSAILFDGITVRSLTGSYERKIPASEFTSSSLMQQMGTALAFPGASPPTVTVKFDPFLHISEPWNPHWPSLIALFAGLAAFFAAVIRWMPWQILAERCRVNPRRTVFLSALLGVTLSCYPILFCGMSWVSPNVGMPLLHEKAPALPTGMMERTEEHAGSDFGATLYCHWPMVFQANRAVFQDGEMPLWNRNSWLGVSQVGQFFHMWGDPLHWLPIATGGASWAWDVKGLLTRLIYAFGCGLLVLRTCGSLRTAAVLTVSSCFVGFFTYRTAHVSVFAFAYMPWVLLAWIEAAQAKTLRRVARCGLLLLAASWQGLNGGTAKEATLTIAALNMLGVIIVLCSEGKWRFRLGKLVCMSWANVLILLLAAPLWMPLLESMRTSYCDYQNVVVRQLQPGLAIGLFDEIFQRQMMPEEFVFSSSANFLFLLGTLWAIASLRTLRTSPVFLSCALCVLAAQAVALGAVPASLLAKIPVIKTVLYFDNVFFFLQFTPLLVVAGLGLTEMWRNVEKEGWKWGYVGAALVFLVLYGAFLGYTESSHREGLSVHKVGEQYYKSAFFVSYASAISVALLVLPGLCWVAVRRKAWAPSALALAFVALAMIHFRMGAHRESSFDRYTYNPKSSYDYRTMKSPSIDFARRAVASEPCRVFGLNGTLMPGFSIIPNLENICGPEAFESLLAHDLIAGLALPRNGWGWVIVSLSEDYPRLKRSLDFLGVRYLFVEARDAMPAALSVAHTSDMQIGESKSAWPRAFFTDTAFAAESAKEVGALVNRGDGKPFAAIPQAMLKEFPALEKDPAGRAISPATNYRLTNNTTTFDIAADGPGLAVLHETNVPGDIVATVDGKEVPCLVVNGAFRGAWIGAPGKHTVKFTYAPRAWSQSLRVALVGAVLALITAACVVRRERAAISAN